MGQVAVPVEGVGMAADDVWIDRIAREPMRPEGRFLPRLEMRLVPDVAAELPPVGMPGMEVRLVHDEAFRVHAGRELRLAGDRPDMGRIGGFLQAHVIVAADGVAVRLEIDVVPDLELHTAAYILHDQAVAAGFGAGEVDVPDVRTGQVLPSGLVRAVGGGLPESDLAGFHGMPGIQIEQPHGLAFIGAVIPGAAVAEPHVQVGRLALFPGGIAEDVHMHGLGLPGPVIVLDLGGGDVGTARGRDVDRVDAPFLHRLGETEVQPVVEFGREGVVPVHRLGLAAGRDRDGPEVGVVLRGDGPAGRGRVQPRVKYHEGVVPVDESVPEEGAGTGSVVPIADVAVLEHDDEGFLVDGLEAFKPGGMRLSTRKEGRRKDGAEQGDSFHILNN